MSCFLYHICQEADKYDFSKGYIGISSNPTYRWKRHRTYEKCNPILSRAYSKYSDIIEYIVVESSRDYCLMLEKALRSENRIGWNIAEGGGNPPNHSGKIMSNSQKERISKSNSGKNCGSWKGYWWVEGIRYDTLKDVSAIYGVTTKCVYDRAHSSKFTDWRFEPVNNDEEEYDSRI